MSDTIWRPECVSTGLVKSSLLNFRQRFKMMDKLVRANLNLPCGLAIE